MKKKFVLFIILASALLIGILISYKLETKDLDTILKNNGGDTLSFNYDTGFYTSNITIEIGIGNEFPREAQIYYCMDGKEPTKEDTLYTEPIVLTSKEKDTLYTIKAAVFYKGETTKAVVRTYMLGSKVLNDFTIPILSITGDQDELYGYENGILIKGKANDGDANFYHKDWIRTVHATLMGTTNGIMIDQNAGVRISGNASRDLEQKSLLLIADSDYDKSFNKFRFIFDNAIEEKGSSISAVNEFKRLRVHSGGQDLMATQLRDELISEIGKQCDIGYVRNTQPVVVFINGSYYGIAHLENSESASYLAEYYGLDKDKIEVVEGEEKQCLKVLGIDALKEIDYSNEKNRLYLEDNFDMDNLISYYAFNMMIKNYDWPFNNVCMWRYTGDKEKGKPYTDGRFRFLVSDIDVCFELDEADPFSELNYGDGNPYMTFIRSILRYEPYRTKFVNVVMDNLTKAFQPENLQETLAIVSSRYGTVFQYAYENTPFDEVKGYLVNHDENVAKLLECMQVRRDEIYDFMYQYYDSGKGYSLQLITPKDNSIICANSLKVYPKSSNIESVRAEGCAVNISAEIGAGRIFSYWLINGEKVHEETVSVSEKDIENDRIAVELVTEAKVGTGLMINKISADKEDDWVELYNPYREAVNLKNYYLADGKEDFNKYQCPDIILNPGESLVIFGRSNPVISRFIMNFNLKDGETLYLYSAEKNSVIDKVKIPKMSENEFYGRYEETQEYRFFKNN